MSDNLNRYGWLVKETFCAPLAARAEWDDVEFVSDVEESLSALPRQNRKSAASSSLATVLLMRANGMKLREIAQSLRCSTDRARQLIARGLRLMRHPDRSRRLAKWVE